jgi:hypothetical protein
MTAVAHTGTPILYLGFSLLIAVFLVLDFVLLKAKGQHKVPVGEALTTENVFVSVTICTYFAVPPELQKRDGRGRRIWGAGCQSVIAMFRFFRVFVVDKSNLHDIPAPPESGRCRFHHQRGAKHANRRPGPGISAHRCAAESHRAAAALCAYANE